MRRVSQRGSIMVAAQRIHVDMIHVRKIITVTADDHTFEIQVAGEVVAVVARISSQEINRYKVYAACPAAQAGHHRASRRDAAGRSAEGPPRCSPNLTRLSRAASMRPPGRG